MIPKGITCSLAAVVNCLLLTSPFSISKCLWVPQLLAWCQQLTSLMKQCLMPSVKQDSLCFRQWGDCGQPCTFEAIPNALGAMYM